MIHNEHSKEAVGIFDAGVSHFDKDVGVLLEVDHQLLLLLHVAEFVFINTVRVVEEQIVFTGKLHFDFMDQTLASSVPEKDLDPDGFKSTDFLRSLTRVLDSQFKRSLSVKHDDMALR